MQSRKQVAEHRLADMQRDEETQVSSGAVGGSVQRERVRVWVYSLLPIPLSLLEVITPDEDFEVMKEVVAAALSAKTMARVVHPQTDRPVLVDRRIQPRVGTRPRRSDEDRRRLGLQS